MYIIFDDYDQYDEKKGVYAITIDSKCVYIGSSNNLRRRYFEHERDTERCKYQAKGLYQVLNQAHEMGSTIRFEILSLMDDLSDHLENRKAIGPYALDIIELAMIRLYQPYFNSKGVDMPFTLDHATTHIQTDNSIITQLKIF